MSKTTVHVVSHSHWDREWYMSFERHHLKLVRLMDELCRLFDEDPEFKSFYLDGQTIILEDYLAVRPERRERLMRYIREGKLRVGPWYVLQDEFLVSGEATARNLLTGVREAQALGETSFVGYFPDAFGNAGQMPQLLKQAGFQAVLFGRGVLPVGKEGLEDPHPFESAFSDMVWQSPDGSDILGVFFANWYNNGMEIPVEEEAAKAFWDDRLMKARRFAATGNLLLLNGCDHQMVQSDLSQALQTARRLYPDIEFIHSTYDQYVRAVEQSLHQPLSTIEGELTSQHTDGWATLANTCSARVYLKQLNHEAQALLEQRAEPLNALAALQGHDYPADELRYAWKVLMQNHPHDSICGCSVDEVHREMQTRYAKSMEMSRALAEEAEQALLGRVDTSAFREMDAQALPLVVFNPTGWARTGLVEAEVELARDCGLDQTAACDRMAELPLPALTLVDEHGKPIDCTLTDLGAGFGYQLPRDRFRVPYMARRVKLRFEAQVPAMGHAAYALIHQQPPVRRASLVTAAHTMENDFLAVHIHRDGRIALTDKKSGHTFEGLLALEDVGEIGNEYIHVSPPKEEPILSEGLRAEIELCEDTPFAASFAVQQRLMVPVSAKRELEEEQRRMVPLRERCTRRRKKLVELCVEIKLTLSREARALKVEVRLENQAKDHRLRLLMPTGLAAKTHWADAPFELVKRDNRPFSGWTYPEYPQHMQGLCALDDGKNGLLVAARGLNEYEVLEDATLAVTLLRAVGELGDWGVFPTPDAQCLGEQRMELMLAPYRKELSTSRALREAVQFRSDLAPVQAGLLSGALPPVWQGLSWQGEGLVLSAYKQAEQGGDLIVRFYNASGREAQLELTLPQGVGAVYESDVLERRLEPLACSGGTCRLAVGGARVVTLALARDC